MPKKALYFKQIPAPLRTDDFALLEATYAVAIGIGWLALVSLLSYGGVLLELRFGAAPLVDRPNLDPDDIRGLLTDSALVLGCCVTIIAAADLFRRRQAA